MELAHDRRLSHASSAARLGGGAWLPVAFFLLVATLMPFAVGPDAQLLARVGGGALWIAALTAALLPIERLVEPDRADGVLDQFAMAGVSEEEVAAAKIDRSLADLRAAADDRRGPGERHARDRRRGAVAVPRRARDRHARARGARGGGGRADRGPAAGRRARRAVAPAACRAPAHLRRRGDVGRWRAALKLEAAVALLRWRARPS